MSKDGITWTDIRNYELVRDIKFEQWEIDYILLINNWANSKIKEMKDNED